MAGDDTTKAKRRVWWQNLRSDVQPEWPWLGVGSLALLGSTLSNQALPGLLGRSMDRQSTYRSHNSSNNSGWMIVVVLVGGGLCSGIRTYTLELCRERLASRLRNTAFGSLMHKNLEWYDNDQRSPAAVSTILNQDVAILSKTLTNTVANILRSSCSVLFSMTHMYSLNAGLFGMTLCIVPLVGGAAMWMHKNIKRLAQHQSTAQSAMVDFLQERLSNLGMVQLCNQTDHETKQYQTLQDDYLKLSESSHMQSATWMGFMFSGSAAALLTIVNMGSRSVRNGDMTGGQLSSFSTYAFLLGLGTGGILKGLSEAVKGMVAAERYYSLLEDANQGGAEVEEEEEKKEDNDEEAFKVDSVESFSVEAASYAYDHHQSSLTPSSPVLKAVSLKLARGQVVAMVGKNGSGKSTFANLLAGLYRPSHGAIDVIQSNNKRTDFTALSRNNRKRLVQLIPQTTALFNVSILENVRYSNPTASIVDVRYALTKANCNDFVGRVPGGLDFVVGPNGNKLSGGERQRLALARALLADPVLLVMDEPELSLDADGVEAVSEAVRSGRGRAMLIITHHAKSLELADTVVVLDNGNIVEQGSFRSLRSNPNSELSQSFRFT